MRIATFNLESLDLVPGGDGALERRIAVLAPQLDALDADVLCLQEVNAQKTAASDRGAAEPGAPRPKRQPMALRRLLAATRHRDDHLVTTHSLSGDGPADVHNLAVVSRYPVLEQRELRNDLVPPQPYHAVTAVPDASADLTLTWDRPLLHCRLQVPGPAPLHVINLHLRSPLAAPIPGRKTAPFVWSSLAGWAEGYFAATIKRSGQALEARLLVEAVFDEEPQALIAVCGDLNADAEETPGRILRGTVEDSGNPDLAGRVLHPLEDSLPQDQRFTVLHDGRRLTLDHILASPALKRGFRDIAVLNATLPDEQTMAPDDPRSNHAPLVAAFDL
ncbi:endonuclease/exonuclease/phosphatase family protein [Pelagibius sp.]|uniref:endonuclease/exonuclease/phosphatase family protein n=1 Tax=Pelagibius sp. TaxID=1931238 RepID=UPI003B50E583